MGFGKGFVIGVIIYVAIAFAAMYFSVPHGENVGALNSTLGATLSKIVNFPASSFIDNFGFMIFINAMIYGVVGGMLFGGK